MASTMNTMNTDNLRLLNVLVAKEAKGELTERQVEKLDALRVELRPVLVKEAIAAALQYEAAVMAAPKGPRRSARLAAKPSVSYADLGDEEVEEDAPPTVGQLRYEAAAAAPRRSARLAVKPTDGQPRYEAAVAALLALRNAGM